MDTKWQWQRPKSVTQIEMPSQARDERIAERAKHIKQYGVETWNQPYYWTVCSTCGRRKPLNIKLDADPSFSFDDYNTMIAVGVMCLLVAANRSDAEVRCCTNSPCKIACDYFVYHSGLGKDLVVRSIQGDAPDSVQHCVQIADADGYRAAPRLTYQDRMTLRRDNLVRYACQWLDTLDDPSTGFDFIERAFVQFPGHPALLRFVSRLLQHGQYLLADGIAREHQMRYPEDRETHHRLDGLLLKGRAIYHREQRLLSQTQKFLRHSIRFRSDLVEANSGFSKCLYLRQNLISLQESDTLFEHWRRFESQN